MTNKLLLAALGLVTALAFSTPALQVTSADAATTSTTAKKKPVHHAMCKPTKTHKCPVAKKKKK